MDAGFKKWLLTEEHEVPNGEILQYIKVAVPKVRQSSNFDCGAAVLRSIAEFYKVGPETECDFVKAVEASKKSGTKPANIVKAAKEFGLKVMMKEHMTINELKRFLDEEKPVICNIQAWGKPKYYKTRDSGHYVIAIGYDDKSIYFEDPSIEKYRGFLSYKDFDKRWHDKEAKNVRTDHLAIVIWKKAWDKDTAYIVKARKIK